MIIENCPSASGAISAELIDQSPADGYSLLMGSTAAVTDKNISPFMPAVLVSASPYIITVTPELNVSSIRGLIAYAKANSGKVRFGSSGSASHFAGELLASMAGIELMHVPYTGAGQALTDLMARHIDFIFARSNGNVSN